MRFCGISSRAVSGVTYYRPNSTCTTLTPRAGHFGWTYFPVVIGQPDIPDHWDGYTRFNAPANTTFSANSNYFLVIDQFGSANSLKTTDSNAEDTATLTGWSIHNGLHHPIGGDWYARRSQLPTENLRISLSGSVATSQVAAPTIEGSPSLSDAGSDGEWASARGCAGDGHLQRRGERRHDRRHAIDRNRTGRHGRSAARPMSAAAARRSSYSDTR